MLIVLVAFIVFIYLSAELGRSTSVTPGKSACGGIGQLFESYWGHWPHGGCLSFDFACTFVIKLLLSLYKFVALHIGFINQLTEILNAIIKSLLLPEGQAW
jgi:hypothetical protein